MRLKPFKGMAADSLLLAAVRVFSMLAGIVSTMILSHKLSLEVYGSYSQGNVIVSIGMSFSILGLSDAVNYFYNGQKAQERERYVNTIFMIQFIAGIIVGVLILCFRRSICAYFHNAQLMNMFIYIAFRPLLDNLINMLQVLYVSTGRARVSAIRNLILSLLKIILVLVIAFVSDDIRILFVGYLLFDLFTVVYYFQSFSRWTFCIMPLRGDVNLVLKILRYSLPMAIYTLTKRLLKDMDKMLIGYLEGTESMAIYANCTYELPFDVISNTFLVVMVPIITRYIAQKDYDSARGVFSEYLRIGYMTTCIFAAGISIVAYETIDVLFGQKYVSGENIFIFYLLIDMIKFANLTLVLSAKGWTKRLMVISIGSLVANFVLNLLFYALIGFAGPAVASVIVSLLTTVVLCMQSAEALETSFLKLIDKKEVAFVVAEMICIAIPLIIFRNLLRSVEASSIVILMLVGGIYVGLIFILNKNRITQVLRRINAFK